MRSIYIPDIVWAQGARRALGYARSQILHQMELPEDARGLILSAETGALMLLPEHTQKVLDKEQALK